MSEFDPKLTFESFVVGPANRLASAAARRAADSPGASYNPLFLYAASGLGKTHILTAIAHQTRTASPERRLEYVALENYLGQLEKVLGEGAGAGRMLFEDVDVLLLDDVQFLAGQREAQEMLLRTVDALLASGRQVVLASDRPPPEIDGLDARLVSRFSGGLIVDLGIPEYETRVAILLKKAEERGQSLEPGVAEALARRPFQNVRELGGGLNKVLAIQELEERRVVAEEIPALFATDTVTGPVGYQEFDSFLDDLMSSLEEIVEEREEPWRKAFREPIDQAVRLGYSAVRLDSYLGGSEPEGWEEAVATFRRDVERLGQIERDLDELDNPWPDAAAGVLKDPERLREAESLLASVRERQRPFRRLAGGQVLSELDDYPRIALRAAEQLVGPERPEYNPLFVTAVDEEVGKTLLGATGRTFQAVRPEARMAVTTVQDFADDFIRALRAGVAGAWRERWWTLDLLLVHGVEALSQTERAQDEFFHLFEALKRRGARMMLVADRAPAEIAGIDPRLRSRFEGGLVLELAAGTPGSDLILEDPTAAVGDARFEPARDMRTVLPGATGVFEDTPTPTETPSPSPRPSEAAPPREGTGHAQVRTVAPVPPDGAEVRPFAEPPADTDGRWFPDRENAIVFWPRMADLLIEELD
jgi:chromosomal replication initiation ATPase DnaA